jgi:hypothetical protein
MKYFVVIGRTGGDQFLTPVTRVIGVATDRDTAVKAIGELTEGVEKFLASSIPEWVVAGVVRHFEIVETAGFSSRPDPPGEQRPACTLPSTPQ